jgi:hypothetical protein
MFRPPLRPRALRRFAPRLEALESRYAPSCSWNAGTQVLTGTGNDAAEIRPDTTGMEIWCNGSYLGVKPSGATMTFNAGGGVNSFTLRNVDSYVGSYTVTPSSVYTTMYGGFTANVNANVQDLILFTGNGDDSINVFPGHAFSSPTVTVHGQGGTDSLAVNDSGYASGSSWKITDVDACVGVTNPHCTNYDGIQTLVMETGAGANSVAIGTYSGTLDNLPLITVSGISSGTDTVIANDSGRIGGDTYQLTQYGLTTGSKGLVLQYYQYVQNVTLKTGAGNDSITVSSVGPGGFLFSSPRVTVTTGGGIDNLTVDDSSSSNNHGYTISDGSVCSDGFQNPCVGYDSNLENLTLKASSGNDNFLVSGTGNQLFDKPLVYVKAGSGTNGLTVDDSGRATDEVYKITESDVSLPNTFGQVVIYPPAKMQTVTLRTSAGTDSTTVSNSVGTLGGLPKVAVLGGGGDNTLTVSDAAYIGGDTYRVTDDQVSLPNTLGLIATYSNVQNVSLKTGSGNDAITVTGAGNAVSGNVRVTIDAGGGEVNSLTVDDSGNPSPENYTINEAAVTLASKPGTPISFSNVQAVFLDTGLLDNQVVVGSTAGTLAGMPACNLFDSGSNDHDVLTVDDHNNPDGTTYTVTPPAPLIGGISIPGWSAQWGQFEQVVVDTGTGDDAVNVAKDTGTLSAMSLTVDGGPGANTLSLYDQKNPAAATYIATSAGADTGAIAVPSLGLDASFQSVHVVNLHRSLKPGSVVDKSGYDPADYILNVFGANGLPPQQSQVNNPNHVLPPPPPSGGGTGPGAQSPANRAPAAAAVGVATRDRKPATDTGFVDPLGGPLG